MKKMLSFALLMAALAGVCLFAPGARAQQTVAAVNGVVTVDASQGRAFYVPVTAAITSVVITNASPGAPLSIVFQENATGGFSVTFGGNIAANACTVNTGALQSTDCEFRYSAQSNTWNGAGGSGSGSGSTLGVFTNSEQDPFLFNTTGAGTCSPTTVMTSGNQFPTNLVYNGLTGLVCGPSSGTANAFSNGVAGLYQGNDTGVGGVYGWDGGVGVLGAAYLAVNNQHGWGMNASCADKSGNTGNICVGNELDVQVNNNSTTGAAALASFRGNGQPAAGTFGAFTIQPGSGTGNFTNGFLCQNGSIASTGTYPCVEVGQQSAGSSQNSQFIKFDAHDGSGIISAFIGLNKAHILSLGSTHTVVGVAYAAYMTSTASLSPNQLVKLDTANNTSVVVCTTADTSCDGFVAEIVSTNCGAASAFCPIIMDTGSITQGILGTGTCTRGDFVIVDTTTNGRIKCQAGRPAAGAYIGRATNSQAVVGNLVGVLTKFQ